MRLRHLILVILFESAYPGWQGRGAYAGPVVMAEVLETLVEIVFLLITARALYAGLRRLLAPTTAPRATRGSSPRQGARSSQGEMTRDPVCGMFVSTEVSRRLSRGGRTLHFCSDECLEKFRRQGGAAIAD